MIPLLSNARRRLAPPLAVAAAAALLAGTASANPIVAGTTSSVSSASFDVFIPFGSPLNPTSMAISETLTGFGDFNLVREGQSGNSITLSSITAVYDGVSAVLGRFRFGSLPGVGTFTGSITDVVLDGSMSGDPSSFVSGNYLAGPHIFGIQLLDVPGGPLNLVTSAAEFTSTFDALPPFAGTVINGEDVQVFIADSDFNPISPAVGSGSNGRIRILAPVPEPSSLVLLGLALLVAVGYARFGRQGVPAP